MRESVILVVVFEATLACGPEQRDRLSEEEFVREHALGMCDPETCFSGTLPEPYDAMGCEDGWIAWGTDALNAARDAGLTYDAACAEESIDAFDPCRHDVFCRVYYGDAPLGSSCERVPTGWNYSTCGKDLNCSVEDSTCHPLGFPD